METQDKRKPGRPVANTVTADYKIPVGDMVQYPNSTTAYTKEPNKKVGHFITVHTPGRKGIRIDLSDISEYAKAGQADTDVQIVFKNGRASVYRFGSEEDAYKFMGLLDEHCL